MADGPNVEQISQPQTVNKQVEQAPVNTSTIMPTQESLNILKPQSPKIIHLPDTLTNVDTQTFLSDKTLQDSIREITNKDDSRLTAQELDELKNALGESINKKKEFISLLNFIQENKTNDFSWDIKSLTKLTKNNQVVEIIVSPKFSEFYKELKDKTGYVLKGSDIYGDNGSQFMGIFFNHSQRLFEEPTIKIIKAIHTNSNLDLFDSYRYTSLADNPNALQAIDALKSSGIDLQQFMIGTYENELQELANSPDLIAKLSSPTFKNMGAQLTKTFNWNLNPEDMIFIAENNLTKERLTSLSKIFEKHQIRSDDPHVWNPTKDFNPSVLNAVLFIEQNEEIVSRLENYNWKFSLSEKDILTSISRLPDKEKFFHTLDILKSNLSHDYAPELIHSYIKLSQIPKAENKILDAAKTLPGNYLVEPEDYKLFTALGADASLYYHAVDLNRSSYFYNIRDAANRIKLFENAILEEKLPDEAVSKIYSLSQKATELDKLGLKLMINSNIADTVGKKDWYKPLLEVSSVEEADRFLTKFMTEAALPAIYPNLSKEKFVAKQNQIIELANRNDRFGEIMEICCRSVGIYGQELPEKGEDFITLMDGIRQSVELNLERDPKLYIQKRAEFSRHQFDKIFENVPDEQKEKIKNMWLDLKPQRRLRVTGEILTNEEDTLSRLKRIKSTVTMDLSEHIRDLFKAKVSEINPEQLEIYKQYLFNSKGEIRQDFPQMYHSIRDYVSSAQQSLKNPQTPKEEKTKLGKSLGSYQAIADSLKALYRLGTISEERYKARINYVSEIDKNISEFSSALKKLRLLDPEKRSVNANTRGLEEQVLTDFGKLKQTMTEENVTAQTLFETKSTVDFKDLATAPDMTQSCQRLTEVTGHNQGAYSRLLDASNEMIDIYELRNGEKNRLARSFIELSNIKIDKETNPKLAVLIDRAYVNPQYQNFSEQFSTEMISHMLDRINEHPELSLLFNNTRLYDNAMPDEVKKLIEQRGYRIRQVSGEYLINQSNVRHLKYYDSFSGLEDVKEPRYVNFTDFNLIEKI